MLFTYVCGTEGRGDTVASQSMLAISYTKAHGTQTQCSEENAGKYDRNYDTHLYCTSLQFAVSAARDKRCQYESTMGARCSRNASALLTRRLRCETGVNLITGWATLSSNNCNQAFAIICNESVTALWRNFGPLILAELFVIQPHWRVFEHEPPF